MDNYKNSAIRVSVNGAPTSADPMDYDQSQHHQCFRSVLGTLTSNYRRGGVIGMLAHAWAVSSDERTWIFDLDQRLTWENGDQLNSDQVVKSLTRSIFLFRSKASAHTWVDVLEGVENVVSPSTPFAGIKADGPYRVVFKFTTVPVRLLDTLSFGNYAISHPADYSASSGAWLDPKRITSIGAYRIKSWERNKIILELRNNFPDNLKTERAFEAAELVWDTDEHKFDLAPGFSTDVIKGMNFLGAVPSGIAYVRCFNWGDTDALCGTLSRRKALRAYLYRKMRDQGEDVPASFFPPSLFKQVKNAHQDVTPTKEFGAEKFQVVLREWPAGFSFYHTVIKALRGIDQEVNLDLKIQPLAKVDLLKCLGKDKGCSVDIAVLGTNILLEDPREDIRYMFLSKEGIQLPDENGSITNMLKQSNFSVEAIDNAVAAQAIIWPVGHYSRGYWVANTVDMGMVNVIQPPLDLAWVGRN